MRRIATTIALITLAAVSTPIMHAQDEAMTVSYEGVLDLDARLAALSPDDPEAYFELAEEVAYEMPGPGGRRLAHTLFVLAFEADRRRPQPAGLGRSVCIALADMSDDAAERRWLRSLAAVLGEVPRSVDWDPQIRDVTNQQTEFMLAEALGYFRAQEYRRARKLLAREDVRSLLNQYTHVVERGRNIITTVENSIACSECRNNRIVKGGSAATNNFRLCATCAGNPGARLSREEYIAHLRLESVLVRANHNSWSAQLTVDEGEPLRDVDPDELAAYFKVAPDRFYWQSDPTEPAPRGTWSPE